MIRFSGSLDKEFERVRTREKLLKRIQESIADSGELNDWEEDFLASIYGQILEGKREELSSGQEDTLDKIELKRAGEDTRTYQSPYDY